MYGGVRVTKQNSIFKLIVNRDATLDDLKELLRIAPEKLNNKNKNLLRKKKTLILSIGYGIKF